MVKQQFIQVWSYKDNWKNITVLKEKWLFSMVKWTVMRKFYLFMTPPSAAGTRTSHSSVSSEFGSIASPPLKPLIPLFCAECFTSWAMSRPLTFLTAPVTSLIAITLPPASVISWAAQEPTLPNPWKRQARHLLLNRSLADEMFSCGCFSMKE